MTNPAPCFPGDLDARIAPLDQRACARARARWNAVAKPIGSLGALEDDIVQIAGLIGDDDVDLGKRALVVMCADNGVVARGVSQCGPEVTRAVATALGNGSSSACAMARPQGIDVVPVDIGMAAPLSDIVSIPGVLDRSVGCGTGDISQGPAMTREQAAVAMQVGIDLAGDLHDQGYRLIIAGEMGIGNTTTASAIAAALFGMAPSEAVGRGAGLSDAGLERKTRAVACALAANPCRPDDALGLLASLGGFDIAGMAGLFAGGALHRVPVVVDGFISAVAAYLAALLCPASACAFLGSHVSAEPAARLVIGELVKKCGPAGVSFAPVIDAGMRLGEGTGAICLVPLLDSALALYRGSSFSDVGIEPYEVDLR